ncbi:cytochrome P450 [Morchella conica CCBAS932]|uniref:Cytochrome P450 n=1 Tax=Morchella conica CCBAS932 TaxID=1392247 RepID=A0A3N4KLX2_9PEZI|nr:cytochrome P450 [Morchella conica CCBAS932]
MGYATAVLIALLVYRLGLYLYRYTLHPLAKFPGPRLAAVSSLYQIYYDIIKDGQLTYHLQDLHKKYGPIVRISHNEIHLSPPSAYHEIYRLNTPLIKHHGFYQLFNLSNSSFGTVSNADHRRKRSVLNQSFSRRTIFELEPLVQSKVDRLVQRLEDEYAGVGREVCVHNAYQAVTIDTVSDFSFGISYGVLNNADFRSRAMEAFDKQQEAFLVFKHFPLLARLAGNMPFWLANLLMPDGAGFLEMEQDCRHQIQHLLSPAADTPPAKAGHPTIFNRLLEAYPDPDEKTIDYLAKEGVTVVSAGTHTTRHALCVGTVYALQKPEVGERLLRELREVMPGVRDVASLKELESLPYLTAFMKESLRLSYGVVGPLPRVVPAEGATIAGAFFPGGTVVIMDSYIVHHNEDLFPSSHEFDPTRWLVPNAKELDKYLVSFSAGSRQCLGMNLAWAELYMVFARVFRRFEMELYEHEGEGIKIVEHWLPTVRGEKVRCTLKVREV